MDLPQIIYNYTSEERKQIIYYVLNIQQRIVDKIEKKHKIKLNPTQFIGLLLRAVRKKFDNGLILNILLNQMRGVINYQLNTQLIMDVLTGENILGILLHRKSISCADDIIESNMFRQVKQELMKDKSSPPTSITETFEYLKLLLINIKDKNLLHLKYFDQQSLIQVLNDIYQMFIKQQMQSKNDKQYFSTISMEKQQIVLNSLNQMYEWFLKISFNDKQIELSMTHILMILMYYFKDQVNTTKLLNIIIKYHFYGKIAESNVSIMMDMFLMKNSLGKIFVKNGQIHLNDVLSQESYINVYNKSVYLSQDFSNKDVFSCILTNLLTRYKDNIFNLKKYNILFQNYQHTVQYLLKGRTNQDTGNQKLLSVIQTLRQKYIDADKSIKYMYLFLISYICENNIFDLQKAMSKHMQEDVTKAAELINFGQYCDGAVTSLQQLQATVIASKFINSWSLYLTLNDKFQFYHINDIIQRQTFKISYRTAAMIYSEDNYFAVVQKVSDGKIFKMLDPTDQFFTDLLYELQDQLVDIVVSTKNKLTIVQNFTIRYLCYQYNSYFNRIVLEFKHPEAIRSLGLYKVNVKNLNACINLNHLHSNENQYVTETINKLTNLKSFISTNDEYKPSKMKTMVNDLMFNNKLEIIVVNNGKNIMPTLLNKNIENLRYVHYDGVQSLDFTMDVSIYPEKVINIQNYNGDVSYTGTADNIERIKMHLLDNQNQLLIYDKVKCMQDSTTTMNKFGIFKDTSQNVKQIIIEMLRIQYCEQKDIESKYKYSILLLINYIRKLSAFEFNTEFEISSVKDAETFVKNVKYHTISSRQQLKAYLIYVRNMEYSSLDFQFNNQFTLDNVSDAQWREICVGKETTMERVYSNQHFVIVRRASDSAIYRQLGFNPNFLSQFINDDMYDIIIVNPNDNDYIGQTALSKIRIRQLSFLRQHPEKITLEHPECIMSLYIKHLTITNLSKCINVVNICSMDNEYTPTDIEELTHLKRFFSQNDLFKSKNKSMLQYLFDKNQLEFVHVENGRYILSENTILNKNLSELRYFYHSNNKFIDFTLDISKEMPEKLKVLANRHFDKILNKGQEQMPIIQGQPDNIKKMKDNLLRYE